MTMEYDLEKDVEKYTSFTICDADDGCPLGYVPLSTIDWEEVKEASGTTYVDGNTYSKEELVSYKRPKILWGKPRDQHLEELVKENKATQDEILIVKLKNNEIITEKNKIYEEMQQYKKEQERLCSEISKLTSEKWDYKESAQKMEKDIAKIRSALGDFRMDEILGDKND